MKILYLNILLSTLLLGSCASYKQNIMFKKGDADVSKIENAVQIAEENYIIHIDDYLKLEVYTKNGERIIDPEFELVNNDNAKNQQNLKPELKYLVKQDGFVKLPMVGEIKLQGMNLKDAEEVLQEKYSVFYKDVFVQLNYVNKRVIVLGAVGGHVIPLENENIRIAEILALAEGIDNSAKVQNIRLLRGEEAFFIDLSTVEGYRQSNMVVRSGDIIYVEPVRRPFTEFMRDNGPVVSAVSSIISLVAVLISINR